MSEIQITVSSRALERLIFSVIIIILLILVIKGYAEDHKTTSSNNVTGNVNLGTGGHNATNTTNATAVPAGTCTDHILNQNETEIDCGGVCGGYWYDNDCHTYQMQCRLNSDCNDPLKKCENYRCVALPPECTKATEAADCESNEQCTSGKCEEKPLSNKITVTIDDVDTTTPTAEGKSKVTQVKFTINNGKANAITLTADLYVYETLADDWADIIQDTIYFPSIASGETYSEYVEVNGKTFSDADNQKTLKAVFDNSEVGTITKRFTAS